MQALFPQEFLQQLSLVVAQERRNFDIEFRELYGHAKARVLKITECVKKVPASEKIESEQDTECLKDFVKRRRQENMIISNDKSSMFHFIKPGDEVEIDTSEKLFKQLHSQVARWDKRQLSMLGRRGVVVERRLPCATIVMLLDTKQSFVTHVDALKLAKPFASLAGASEEMAPPIKVGYLVRVVVEPDVLVSVLQSRGVPGNLAQIVSSVGHIIWLNGGEAIVSWNYFHSTTLPINILKPCTRSETKKFCQSRPHSLPHALKSMKEHTQVFVNTNLFEVMKLQDGHGSWDFEMTKHIGHKGDIIDIFPGKQALVYFKDTGCCHMFNSDALLNAQEKRKRNNSGSKPEEPKFKVGDIVRFNLSQAQSKALVTLKGIPEEFSKVAMEGAEVLGYANPTHVVVKFDSGQRFQYDAKKLVAVQPNEAKFMTEWRKQNSNLKIDDEVMIWFGPTSFATACVTFRKESEEIVQEKATLIGYKKDGDVIVSYRSGQRYAVPREYICAAREDWIDQNEEVQKNATEPTVEAKKEEQIVLQSNEIQDLLMIYRAIERYKDADTNDAISQVQYEVQIQRIDGELYFTFEGSGVKEIREWLTRHFEENPSSLDSSHDFSSGCVFKTKEKLNFRVNFGETISENAEHSKMHAPFTSPQGDKPPNNGSLEACLSLGDNRNPPGNAAPFPALANQDVQTVVIPENTKQVVIQIGRGDFDHPPLPRALPGGENRGDRNQRGAEYTTVYEDSVHNTFNNCNVQLRQ